MRVIVYNDDRRRGMGTRGRGVVVDELERISRDDAGLRRGPLDGEFLLEQSSHLGAVVQLVVEGDGHVRAHVIGGEREVGVDVRRNLGAAMVVCALGVGDSPTTIVLVGRALSACTARNRIRMMK